MSFSKKMLQYLWNEHKDLIDPYWAVQTAARTFSDLSIEDRNALGRYFYSRTDAINRLNRKLSFDKNSKLNRHQVWKHQFPERMNRKKADALIKMLLKPEKYKPTLGQLYEAWYRYNGLSGRTANAEATKMFWKHHSNRTERRPVVWENEWWYTDSWEARGHQAHMSTKDPNLIAYTQSVDKLLRDVQTPIKPGRYLQQYFGHVLSAKEIHYWASRQTATLEKKYKLCVLDNNDPKWKGEKRKLMRLWRDLYNRCLVDYSCMRGSYAPSVYGLPGNSLGLVTWAPANAEDPFEDGNIKMFGRAIIRTDKSPHEVVRVYPFSETDTDAHESALQVQLTTLGYKITRNLDGIFLAFERDGFKIVCPYLDGDAQNVSLSSFNGEDALYISYDGDYNATSTGGYVEAATCDECGDFCNPDELEYVPGEDIHVCPNCRTDYFVRANHRYGDVVLIREDEAIRCMSDDEFYTEEGVDYYNLISAEAGPSRGDVFHEDDVVMTSRGYVYCDEAVELSEPDPEGNDWALERDTVLTEDGDTIHTNSAISTVDGETYHIDNEVLLTWKSEDGDTAYIASDRLAGELDHFTVIGDTILYGDVPPERGAMLLLECAHAFGLNDLVDNPEQWIEAIEDDLEAFGYIEKLAA